MPKKIPKRTSATKRIYLDYAASTPVDPRVAKKIAADLKDIFANTMSFHSFGQAARQVLEDSRKTMADLLGARTDEIVFTGSATESNNLALKGVALANRARGSHIVISPIEHACVSESARWLESQGFSVTRLSVDKYGLVDPADVAAAITPQTILVSVMHANNEIGVIEPVAEIGRICRQKGVHFHTDAAQTFGKVPVNVNKLNVDLLTASAQKIYGPKGAALLFIRKGVNIQPIIHGGGHEFGLRAATVNVPAIYGFAEAATIAHRLMPVETKRLRRLRDRLINGILKTIPGSYLNGPPVTGRQVENRLPNILNVWFEFVEGESMIIQLDLHGIAASTGSACSSAKLQPSHVLLAIGLKPQEAHGSLRFSVGRWSTDAEVNYVLKVLPNIIKRLREISPFKQHE